MNELIKYFNENYGKDYGKISYPRTTLQIYQVYQTIKSYGIKDDSLLLLLGNIKLPKPKTIKEKEIYSDCLYNIDDSEIKDQLELLPMKNKKSILKNAIPSGCEEKEIEGVNAKVYYFEDNQASIPSNNFKSLFADGIEALRCRIKYNNGIEDIVEDVDLEPEYDDSSFEYSNILGEKNLYITFSPYNKFAEDFTNIKWRIYIYEVKQASHTATFYEVKELTLHYEYYSNLIQNEYIESIDFNKVKNIDWKLQNIMNGSQCTLSTEEYGRLKKRLDLEKVNLGETLPNETCTATEDNHVIPDTYGNMSLYIRNLESEGFRGIKISDYKSNGYTVNIKMLEDSNIKVKIVKHIIWKNDKEEFTVAYSNFEEDKITKRRIVWQDASGITCKKYDLYILFAVPDIDEDSYYNYVGITIYRTNYFFNADELVPSGGTTGQILTKKSNTDNDVGWATPQKIPTKVSELTNDSKYLTAIPSQYITETTLNNIIKFNSNGELVITINGVSKTFVPKSE